MKNFAIGSLAGLTLMAAIIMLVGLVQALWGVPPVVFNLRMAGSGALAMMLGAGGLWLLTRSLQAEEETQ